MRYFIGFLVTVGLLIVLIILLFHSNNKTVVPTTSAPLVSYTNSDAEVRLTIDGPVTADQTHQQIQITVNKDTTTYDQIQGYEGTVVNQQQYSNNENSFDTFLHALQIAGFTEGDNSSSLKDERGHCALGKRYIYEIIQNGKDLERYWTTTCGTTIKTYDGLVNLTIELFQAQVPDYKTLSSTTSL